MRAWSGVKIDMLARWEAALCSEPDIYWINTVRDLHRWDMVLATTQVMRYAHDLPRSPYHRVGQVAQTIGQIQGRDNQ